MRAGMLRKQIAVQAEQPTTDGAGGYALAWVALATVWGEIEPVSGRQVYADGHIEGHVTHRVVVRWRSDVTITVDMRLVYNGRMFNILSVINDGERNHQVTLLVEEGGAV